MSAPTERWLATLDGLKLFVSDHDAAPPDRLPVVCLPGLTRCERDFAALADALAPERRVLRLAMRGRGRSGYDPNPLNYNVLTETADVLCALDALGIGRAAFVGTSRGGIQTMLIAQLRPGLIAGAVLNDIGPRIEAPGLARIVEGLTRSPQRFASWDEATTLLEAAQKDQFPALTRAEWSAYARRLYVERDGAPAPDYDAGLIEAVRVAAEQPPPELWAQFDLLAGAPLLAIRGDRSDVLSARTLDEMRARLPGMAALTLADRGHAPFLDEPEAVAAIRALLQECDRCATTPLSEPPAPPTSATPQNG